MGSFTPVSLCRCPRSVVPFNFRPNPSPPFFRSHTTVLDSFSSSAGTPAHFYRGESNPPLFSSTQTSRIQSPLFLSFPSSIESNLPSHFSLYLFLPAPTPSPLSFSLDVPTDFFLRGPWCARNRSGTNFSTDPEFQKDDLFSLFLYSDADSQPTPWQRQMCGPSLLFVFSDDEDVRFLFPSKFQTPTFLPFTNLAPPGEPTLPLRIFWRLPKFLKVNIPISPCHPLSI